MFVKIFSPSSSLTLLAKTITHRVARSLCNSWVSCEYSEVHVLQEIDHNLALDLSWGRMVFWHPLPSRLHRLNAYWTVIVWVSYGYGYTRGSGRVWVEIFGAGRVRVRVASSATSTGRVAEMIDPYTPSLVVINADHIKFVLGQIWSTFYGLVAYFLTFHAL